MKHYSLIVAHDEKLGIGKNNKLPWQIKGDLKHFRDLTSAFTKKEDSEKMNVVIMGRKTWESLPANYKPLPNRNNLVISRNSNYALPNNVMHSKSVEHALEVLKQVDYGDVFIIGGAVIYEIAIKLQIFDTLHVTEIEGEYNCDVFFPQYKNDFKLIDSSGTILEGDYRFSFKTYTRIRTQPCP